MSLKCPPESGSSPLNDVMTQHASFLLQKSTLSLVHEWVYMFFVNEGGSKAPGLISLAPTSRSADLASFLLILRVERSRGDARPVSRSQAGTEQWAAPGETCQPCVVSTYGSLERWDVSLSRPRESRSAESFHRRHRRPCEINHQHSKPLNTSKQPLAL